MYICIFFLLKLFSYFLFLKIYIYIFVVIFGDTFITKLYWIPFLFYAWFFYLKKCLVKLCLFFNILKNILLVIVKV